MARMLIWLAIVILALWLILRLAFGILEGILNIIPLGLVILLVILWLLFRTR